MKIYTKTGDKGDTALFGGQRVPKDALRVEAYGTVDELNSVLGIVLADYNESDIEMVLRPVQMKLFALGAELATPDPQKTSGIPRIGKEETAHMESLIDSLGANLPPLRNFILPGGTPAAARIHFARTVCRRAERAVVRLSHKEPVSDETIAYLNRLSDLLFVLARYVNAKAGVQEVPWKS
jgi:cob(I)alamin adenosyltransferase